MIDTYLKISFISLALLWIFCLILMYKIYISGTDKHDLQFTKSINTVPRNNNIENHESNDNKTFFSRWKDIMYGGEGICSTIIESNNWKHEISEYKDFKEFCKEKNINIVKTDKLESSSFSNLHFDDPVLMPLLWSKGYYIEVVKGKSLLELMKEVSPFTLIIISVKDDGSQALSHRWQEQLMAFGIHSLTREHLRYSYLNVIWTKGDHSYHSLYEDISEVALSKEFEIGSDLNGFTSPIHLELYSAGFNSGNSSSIKIDGQEYASNLRGMNIVLYDLIELKVKGIHRVDTSVSIYEDSTIYRALSKEDNHAL